MAARIATVLMVAASLLSAPSAFAADDEGRTEAAARLARLIASAQPSPVTLPDPNGPRSTQPGQLVTHDLKTGKTFVHTEFGPAPSAARASVPAGAGALELLGDSSMVPGSSKNFTFWQAVADPTSGTYPRRVRIQSKFLDSTDTLRTFYGSGTLIDSYHVITAAHVIYMLPGGPYVYPDPWAQSVTVVPAYSNGTAPFGDATATALHSWTNFTVDADWQHDLGVITLDRPIGGLTGWWGYGYNTDYNYYTSGTWRHAGWPGEDPYDGETLYENVGTFDQSPIDGWDWRIGFFAPTWGGTSGAGAVRDGAVFGVFSGSNRIDHSEDVILTPTKFSHIEGWINALTPSGWDLIPMFVQTDASVLAGASLSSLSFVLHNYGASWANTTVNYTIYLSSDASITSSDLYLGTGSFSISLPDKNSQLITLSPPSIPSYVASGDWFVGVIIDVPDADASNNDTSGQEAAPLTVSCAAAPPAPILTAPNDGAQCRPRDNLYLTWSDLGSGDEYEIQLGTSPGTGSVSTVSNQTNLPLSGLAASTTYYWRVRGRLGCGSFGPWSASRSFRTEPNLYGVSTLVEPTDGEHCLSQSVTLGWTALPDAASYEVQISPNWCYEGAITSGIIGTQYTANGLTPNTTYYWRVRALTTCGDMTDWSSVPGFCWTFKTAPSSISPPTIIGPADGATCANLLIWNHAEDWDHYEVQVGTACGTGTIYTTVSNGLWPEGLVDGEVYVWRVRTVHECGLTSDWTACRSFTLDQEPPTNPTTLTSNSHQVGVWSTDNTIDVYWDWGYDNCSGSFPQYATLWDTNPTTEPTIPTTSGETTLETSPPLPDGQSHWFHVRTIDWAGNMALDTLHLGPFWIDATPPDSVEGLWLCEPLGLPGDFDPLTAQWDATVDSTSGLAGYSWVVVTGLPAAAVPDDLVETSGESANPVLSSGGGWSFGVKAVDNAGNSGPVSAVGQVLHNPNLPEFLAPVCGTELNEGQSYDVEWEPVSGVAGGRLRLSTDGGASFSLVTELDVSTLAAGTWSWTVPQADTDRALLQLELDYAGGRPTAASRFFTINLVTATLPGELPSIQGVRLVGNYPNPFNPATTIVFRVEQTTKVRLEIYDLAGRRVRRLVDGLRNGPQQHEVIWNGCGRRRAQSREWSLLLPVGNSLGERDAADGVVGVITCAKRGPDAPGPAISRNFLLSPRFGTELRPSASCHGWPASGPPRTRAPRRFWPCDRVSLRIPCPLGRAARRPRPWSRRQCLTRDSHSANGSCRRDPSRCPNARRAASDCRPRRSPSRGMYFRLRGR